MLPAEIRRFFELLSDCEEATIKDELADFEDRYIFYVEGRPVIYVYRLGHLMRFLELMELTSNSDASVRYEIEKFMERRPAG